MQWREGLSSEDGDVTLVRRDPWAPWVLRRGERHLLRLHVASGHWDRTYEFDLEERHVAVLREDEQRYYFLYAALHHPFQLRETCLEPAEVDTYVETVLFGAPADVEAFLTGLDRACNGAVSHILAIFTGRHHAELRSGFWFTTS